ncbi:MAG TPA: hypothetical protein VN726_05575 [Hanamia sp.]|nr:hypothetical protein [Hanamia sp.]
MEVHHHPHVEKKGFKEYFLEFLMIFLAVTLGFFAENIREKITNRAIENEYMQSLVSDLEADTSAISQAIDEWSSANQDVVVIQQSLKARPVHVKDFYKSLSEDFWHFDLFKYDNKTVEELKSSGNFRLISDKKIENQIMSFDLDMKYLLTQEKDVKDLMNVSKLAEEKIADYTQIQFGNFNNDSSYSLLNNDPKLIGEYYNKLLAFNKLSVYHEFLFRQVLVKAKNLLETIRKEYH